MGKLSIFVFGEVSSGKSSFINSIAGGYVCNASLQRETFQPTIFYFSNNGSKTIFESIRKRTS
jgi:GTPase SAR1 family protein